jgi:hypothetical protein
MKDIISIDSTSDQSQQIVAINNNFKTLVAGLKEIVPELYDIDLYNIQGQIFSSEAQTQYARLPYNSALIWYLPDKEYSFLGQTYSNGDYILKLGNDVPIKIAHDVKGTYQPSFLTVDGVTTLKYNYNPTDTDAVSTTIFTKGDSGENRTFSCIHVSANNVDTTIDTNISSSSTFPRVEFFLNYSAIGADNTLATFNDPILIDYNITLSTTNYMINFPDGNPACYAVFR